jgi:hypothetical protein
MKGLKVQCPSCKRCLFETTDHYDPGMTPTGASVKSLLPYHIDWLCSSTTPVAMMTCPECEAQLAPSGRLTVIQPEPMPVTPMEVGIPGTETATEDMAEAQVDDPPPAFVCDICGKVLKNKFGLDGHMKSHKGKP